MIEVAVENRKPVRIGVNWGSLDAVLLTRMMDENSLLPEPKDAREVTLDAMVASALQSAQAAERYGLAHDQIILSAKVSGVQDLIDVYRMLAAVCDYPLHLGLTEAGSGQQGNRGHHGGARAGAAGRHRRHHSRVADAAAEWRSHRGSDRLAADSAVAGDPQFHAAGDGVPRLRAHHQHVLPGDGGRDPDLPARADAASGRPRIPAWRP